MKGLLEINPNGNGFLRNPARHYRPAATDPQVPAGMLRSMGLAQGVVVEARLDGRTPPGRAPFVRDILSVEGMPIAEWRRLRPFDEGTVIHPEKAFKFETVADRMTTRIVDLLTPIGKGQRALIVSPPRAGKTVLLEHLAAALATNHPEVHVIVMLIDERPEEMTHFRRALPKAEVMGTTNDCELGDHVRTARLIMDRAKRLVECGKDAVVLLDSLTRLARAFNNFMSGSGRTMTGGLDVHAMEEPRRMFAAARKIEGGGSLTIIATVLIETGSRMDEFIFQEFKGTGNMEFVLDRKLAEKRIWPAVDVNMSGTRKEEALFGEDRTRQVGFLRKVLNQVKPQEATPMLLEKLAKFKTNAEFFKMMEKSS